jgi:hypothetical protein
MSAAIATPPRRTSRHPKLPKSICGLAREDQALAVSIFVILLPHPDRLTREGICARVCSGIEDAAAFSQLLDTMSRRKSSTFKMGSMS